MKPEDLKELLEQYATLTRKLVDGEKQLDKLHELVRVEGVYTYTSSNKQIWSDIHEKRAELNEVSGKLTETLDRILTLMETNKPL
jgi:hypothetical protein